MKKKLIVLACLMLVVVLGLPSVTIASSNPVLVNQTSAKVLVNGVLTDFEAYTINGNNYFKLRDIAKVVSGTQKQFEVTWDEGKKAINLVSNVAYTQTGGELAKGDGKPKPAVLNTSVIYKDGVIVNLTAFTINGNNFFKLRDLAQTFNIGVTWDGASSTVGIDTTHGYVLEGVAHENAIALASKILVNGVEKSLEAYTINGKEYFRLGDLSLVLQGTEKSFSAATYTAGDFTIIDTRKDYNTTSGKLLVGQLEKGDGTTKKANLITPKVYYNEHEIRSFTVFEINGSHYYQLDELMELISCGVIRDKNANTINLATNKAYEPEFLPITTGDAAYRKLQQDLYDSYYKFPEGQRENAVFVEGRVTVPDNTTLYVPNGVNIETNSGNRIFLGNNSTFHVRGNWIVEYPDKVLFPVSAQTRNAIYVDENPLESFRPMVVYHRETPLTTGVIVRLDGNNWAWNETDIPFESASISYGTSKHGVEEIILNFTRKKLDIKLDMKVVLHDQSGKTYTLQYRNVRKNVDLVPQLANIVGENIGKNITITKIDVYNYYLGPHDNPDNKVVLKPISIPVNWNIVTSGNAPIVQGLAELKYFTDIETVLHFYGLENQSYLAKYKYAAQSNRVEIVNYGIISPDNKHAVRHVGFGDEMISELIVGDSSNVAVFKGQRGATPGSYIFTVSPLSQNIMYGVDFDYPAEADLTTEDGKTWLNYKMVNPQGLPSKYNPRYLMIRSIAKGATTASPTVIYKGEVRGDKLDITQLLTSQIDKLLIHGYIGNTPTAKYVEIKLDSQVATMESVKLGADTLVDINKNILPGNQATEPITSNVAFKNQTTQRLSMIQISPTGKNTWTDVLNAQDFNSQIDHGQTFVLPMTFNKNTLWDIKITYSDLLAWDADGNKYNRFYEIIGVDFAGISAEPGASIELKYEMFSGKTVAIVTNNIVASAPKPGDYRTDTIDIVLVAGDKVKSFNVSDFSLVLNDGTTNKYPHNDIRIVDLSQTRAGNAKLTIARDLIQQVNLNQYFNELNLYYKDYKVGKITFNNW